MTCLKTKVKDLQLKKSNEKTGFVNELSGGPWDGSKKSSKEVSSREDIFVRLRDGATSNWLKTSITYQNSEMVHVEPSQNLIHLPSHDESCN